MGDDDASVVTTGRCMCGDIRFEYLGAPIETGHCHCESCRRHTSAGRAGPDVTRVIMARRADVLSESRRALPVGGCHAPPFTPPAAPPREGHRTRPGGSAPRGSRCVEYENPFQSQATGKLPEAARHSRLPRRPSTPGGKHDRQREANPLGVCRRRRVRCACGPGVGAGRQNRHPQRSIRGLSRLWRQGVDRSRENGY